MNNAYCYNYIDLRLHHHMYNFHDYKDVRTFFRSILTEERDMIEDFSPEAIFEALRRQFETFVGTWKDEYNTLASIAIDKCILDLH